MEFDNIENICHIDVDGNEIWASRSVAVVVMLLMKYEGEIYVAMGKRGKAVPNAVGLWCMPCGFLDWNESCEDAAVRETWEEIGFNVLKAPGTYEVLKDQMNFPWKIQSSPDSEQENVSMSYAMYLDTKYMENPRLPELTFEHNPIVGEVDELEWIKVDDLHEYDCAFGHEVSIRIYVSNIDPELK